MLYLPIYDGAELKTASLVPARILRCIGSPASMTLPDKGSSISNRNLPVNLAIISNLAVDVFSTKPMRLNSDGGRVRRGPRGPQPGPVAGA